MAKKAAAPTSATARTATGVEAAKQFFDLAENEVTGEGLRNAIGYNNQQIIALAKSFGYVFDYDDMQEHLIERFGCTTPSKHMYCCT
jgi:hypothetical protein